MRYASTVLAYVYAEPGTALIDWARIAPALLAGALGGAFYVLVVDRGAFGKAFASFQMSVPELRQWPYRPTEDE